MGSLNSAYQISDTDSINRLKTLYTGERVGSDALLE